MDPNARGRSELGQRRGQPTLGGIVHGVRVHCIAQAARHGGHGDAWIAQQVLNQRRLEHAAHEQHIDFARIHGFDRIAASQRQQGRILRRDPVGL